MKTYELSCLEANGIRMTREKPWRQPPPPAPAKLKTPEELKKEEEDVLFHSGI